MHGFSVVFCLRNLKKMVECLEIIFGLEFSVSTLEFFGFQKLLAVLGIAESERVCTVVQGRVVAEFCMTTVAKVL